MLHNLRNIAVLYFSVIWVDGDKNADDKVGKLDLVITWGTHSTASSQCKAICRLFNSRSMMSVDDDDNVDGADESVAECWTLLMVIIMPMLKMWPKSRSLMTIAIKSNSVYAYTGNVNALIKEIAVKRSAPNWGLFIWLTCLKTGLNWVLHIWLTCLNTSSLSSYFPK